MVTVRVFLAPALVLTAVRCAHPEPWLGGMILAAFLSDIYDGVFARRWGTDTARLRLADSIADTLFYLAVLTAIIDRHWLALFARAYLLAGVLLLEVLRFIFDMVKFRRMASYHSYAAKLWGIFLATAAIALLCFNCCYWTLTLALLWGILCDLEGLAMSVVLPVWKRDVKSLRSAILLRRQIIAKAE
jgi:CDP-diacylglycerol--glycerol-3-phosphate 3-phosphatidyltransferase